MRCGGSGTIWEHYDEPWLMMDCGSPCPGCEDCRCPDCDEGYQLFRRGPSNMIMDLVKKICPICHGSGRREGR